MVRKLAVALFSLGLLSPSLANALGLGEIELKSHLSEPFHAEIELLQVRDLTIQEVLPGLAAKSDFDRANVDRDFFLTGMRFETVFKDDGSAVIKITSRKPVREPFLNFLVEVHWPAGRLLREYTVLLDPPAFAEQGRTKSVSPAQTSQPAPRQTASQPRQAAPSDTARTTPAPSYGRRTDQSAAPETSRPSQGQTQDRYRTSSQDSLWGVAQRLKPSRNVTVQQTMIALQRQNPEAFIDDNINLMRAGQVLRVPSEEQVRRISRRQAIDEVARQNQAWQNKVAQRSGQSQPVQKAAIEGTGRTAAPPSEEEGGGQLRLVSGDESGAGADGSSGGSGGASSAALESRLASIEEGLEKTKLENENLKVQVNDLGEQLETSEKLIELKDDQLASMQAKLAELEEQNKRLAEQAAQQAAAQQARAEEEAESAQPEQPLDEAVDDMAEEVAGEADEMMDQAADVAGEAEDMADEATQEMADAADQVSEDIDYNFQPEPEEKAPTTVDTSDESEVTAVTPPEQPTAQDSKPQPTQPQPKGFMDSLLSNPLYLGIAVIAILLAIAGALFMARRNKADEEDEFAAELEEDFGAESFEGFDTGTETEDEEDFGSPDDDFDTGAAAAPENPEEKDVMGEADIYIAYGRYAQAIEFLQKAIEEDPVRADYRLKLLEVFVEAGDREGFVNAENELTALGNDDANRQATELHDKLRANTGGAEAEASTDEDDATVMMTPESGERTETPADSDDTVEFDLSADFEAEGEEEATPSLDELEQELAPSDASMDLDDFETPEAEQQPEELESSFDVEPQEEQAEALEFELGEDLEPDHDAGDETMVAPVAEEEEPSAEAPEQSDSEIDADAAASIADELGDELDLDLGDMGTSQEPVADAGAPQEPEAEVPEPASGDEDMEFTLEDTAFDELESDTPEDTPATPSDDEFSLDTDVSEPLDEPQSLDSQTSSELTEPEAAGAAEETFESLDEGLDGLGELDDELDTELPATGAGSDASNLETAETFLSGDEDDLGFLSDSDEIATKLDLARAYIDMGDRDGAKDILDEVMLEGDDDQQKEAKSLLDRIEK